MSAFRKAVWTAIAVAVMLFSAPQAATADCGTEEIIPKLLPLLGDSDFDACQQATGYVFYPFAGLPTESQMKDLCTSEVCQSLLTTVVDADLPRCDIEYAGTIYNINAIIEQYADQCLPSSQ
uniref:Elicitin n=1 Tax=Globisporangium ultimum (strain ATCC 200006 / CBS 805.95 / DAOM BR144) TaxID=431595 RepID=K3X1J0_GLOUD